jgi:hypothetical protein
MQLPVIGDVVEWEQKPWHVHWVTGRGDLVLRRCENGVDVYDTVPPECVRR